jgi:hypothetical protein
MNAIRARLAAVVTSSILAALASWGVREASPEVTGALSAWVNHTFDLLLMIGYAVVHPWLQRRLNPTGAFSGEAARRLEHAAHVRGL